MQFAGSHILSISQFERADVERLFTVADAMRPYAHRERMTRVLDGAILGSMFTSSLVFFILLIRFCVCEAIFIFIPNAESL